MSIEVLGPLTVGGVAGRLSRRDRVVLAALVTADGHAVPVDQLAEAMWGDEPPTSARKVVQGCVVRLRRELPARAIETAGDGYRLSMTPEEVDARRFEQLATRSRDLLVLREAERARLMAAEALSLWRGPPLPDLQEWEQGRIESERLEALRWDTEELWAEAELACGRHDTIVAELRRHVSEQPLREHRWALLALAQYRAGRQSEALETLRRIRDVLHRELALDPGQELVDLEHAILSHDPALVGQTPVEPPGACPYVGLVAYQVEDADAFFGREDDVEDCLRRLRSGGVLTVAGPSGSGKSSLVRAGLAASLRQQGRAVTVVVPGRRPLECLDDLASARTGMVLVVDQCESVFSLCESAEERWEFLEALTRHAAEAPLVLCLRSDRIGSLAEHHRLARLAERGLYLLGPLGEEQLRWAVEEPARRSGLLLEPGLVDLLVAEVLGESGALPLLSHALRQTWERREGRVLTVAGYRDSGGIRGAVAQSAERVYARVPADQRLMMRELMLRLVVPGAEGEPVGSRIPRRLVLAGHEAIVDLLAGARLVTAGRDFVELAHESLARAWPRLSDWWADDTHGQQIRRHLTAAADAWDAMDRPTSELYRGARLIQARAWYEHDEPRLTAGESAFISASVRLHEEQEQTALHQARHERRVNRRLRSSLLALGVLTVATALAGGLALRQADLARRAQTEADAGRVGAQAVLTERPDRAVLLAVAAVRLHDSPDTRANLLDVLTRAPQLIGSTRGSRGGFYSVQVSPDGRRLAVYDDENVVWLYDAASLRVVDSFDANLPGTARDTIYPTAPLAYRPDGTLLAVGTSTLDPQPITLVDTTTFDAAAVQLGGQPRSPSHVIDLDISRDGRLLAATFDHYRQESSEVRSSSLVVWDLRRPERPLRHRRVAGFSPVALSPDGLVAVAVGGGGRGPPDAGGAPSRPPRHEVERAEPR